jgi:hypothetical protein
MKVTENGWLTCLLSPDTQPRDFMLGLILNDAFSTALVMYHQMKNDMMMLKNQLARMQSGYNLL